MATQSASRAVDVVAVLRMDTLAQVFPLARPIEATVFDASTLMEHPLEDGSQIADHKVKHPVEITLPLHLSGDFTAVFATIQQLYDAGTLLSVQTRARTYASMVLVEIPHSNTPDAIDTLAVVVKFREARFVKAIYGGLAPAQVKDKKKASTSKRGAQQTTTTPPAKAAVASNQYRGSTAFRITR